MIEHISSIISRVIHSTRLAQAEKVVLDKYESLLPKPAKEEKKEEVKKEEVVAEPI